MVLPVVWHRSMDDVYSLKGAHPVSFISAEEAQTKKPRCFHQGFFTSLFVGV